MSYDHHGIFPGASHYRALRMPTSQGIRESNPDNAFPWSERHLRCVWIDPALRPQPLFTADGRQIIVENPGRWNLEAGPDFLDAVLRTAPDQAVMRGDVELHIRPADWRRHGHAADRRYHQLIAHVTYFEGTLPASDLPSSVLQIALRLPLRQNPLFSFESLDLPAYPYATLSETPPCAAILKSWTPEQRSDLLEAAGQERLRLKAIRITEAIGTGSPEQILYEEIMASLGYKQNRSPFLKLARHLPLQRLRDESGGNPVFAYALLSGVAGLLPTKTDTHWDQETRGFVRTLWDFWWKRTADWHPMILPRSEWVLGNIRPANNPLRRLMAAAELFIGNDPPAERIIDACKTPNPSWASICNLLEASGQNSYWIWRNSLSSARNPAPCALIGPGRAATILTNVLVPWSSAVCGQSPAREILSALPPEDDNRHARHTAHALFGRDHNPSLYHSGLRQQGLLQIFNDFCLNSRNLCRSCPLPELFKRSSNKAPDFAFSPEHI